MPRATARKQILPLLSAGLASDSRAQGDCMEIHSLISEQLNNIEQALIAELSMYKDSDLKSKVENLLNPEIVPILNYRRMMGIECESSFHEMNEVEYLLSAAYNYRIAVTEINSLDYAFHWMMLAQESLGAMRAIKIHRRQNGRKGRKEEIEAKERFRKYWRENIDRTLSGPKAAEILAKQEKLSIRKLTEYVNEFKRREEVIERIDASRAEFNAIPLEELIRISKADFGMK